MPPPADAATPDRAEGELQNRLSVRGASGRRLAYVEAGDGPAVILIHGAMTNADDMALGPMDALARSHRVIAFDRPGHGASPRRRLIEASPWSQAQAIHEAAQALGLVRPIVVGHSFGGAVAIAYALAFPQDAAGVVALAPIVWPEPRFETLLFGGRAPPGVGDMIGNVAKATTDKAVLPMLWGGMFLPQVMPERFRDNFSFASAASAETTRATGEDAIAIQTALWRSVLAYRTCKVPIRVLGGDSDLVVNNTIHGLALCQTLPDGRFNSLRGLGHMLHHFAIDEVVAAVVSLETAAAA